MDIIIAGGGKVGIALARQLAAEGHNLTIIDQKNNYCSRNCKVFVAIDN